MTLDVGGLIALERNHRRVVVLLVRARETGATVIVPATAIAQVVRVPERLVVTLAFLALGGAETTQG